MKTKSRKKQRAASDFREESVCLVRSGSSFEKIASSLNINPLTMGSWLRKNKALERKSSVKNEYGKTMLELESKNKQLLKELDYEKRANKALKIANVFFSQESLEREMKG